MLAQPTEITEKLMHMQTTFLQNVTSIEVTKKPFYSENIRIEQIRIVIQCNDGRNSMESELFLIAKDGDTIAVNIEDFNQEYLED